ncbi:MAG: hypothetical protein WCT53_04465 [Candidatus Gracilibacteria bacterium]
MEQGRQPGEERRTPEAKQVSVERANEVLSAVMRIANEMGVYFQELDDVACLGWPTKIPPSNKPLNLRADDTLETFKELLRHACLYTKAFEISDLAKSIKRDDGAKATIHSAWIDTWQDRLKPIAPQLFAKARKNIEQKQLASEKNEQYKKDIAELKRFAHLMRIWLAERLLRIVPMG